MTRIRPINLIASLQKEHIEQLDQSIGRIEKAVLVCARELPYYERLNTLPGVGRILGMTIYDVEVGDIQRFKTAGDFASYAAGRWTRGGRATSRARAGTTANAATNI